MSEIEFKCVVCGTKLDGRQVLFCSNKCKQTDKNERKRGRRCAKCHKPITHPIPVMGGFSQQCCRQRCLNKKESESERRKVVLEVRK